MKHMQELGQRTFGTFLHGLVPPDKLLKDEGDISTFCNLVLGLSHHDLDMCPSQQSTTFITELEVKGYWAYGFEVNQMKFIFKRVIFNIVNFSKTKSLYRDGMAPMVKSTSRPKWHNSLHWRFKRKVSAPATKRVWASDEATYNALSSNRIPILVISIGFFGIGTLGVWNPDVDA
ncbi:hypothetical protein MJG53_002021 [Ovis ammon polii x Ovis aries]|uniref:Uncharacterized protein n=1 Tax=Ovis ammon polii x Ovis aries TaxID=2918886 RepID=A0ACB9VM04_9CETA|nr:hypothetical protein MJG53_002021 [Ovis ammon polii x Ovis aries]